MYFFVPNTSDAEEAEFTYSAITEFNYARMPDKKSERIFKLRWTHNRMDMNCEVGKPLPSYYGTGKELVMAILDAGHLYKICTPSRGVFLGDAVFAGKNYDTYVTYFSDEDEDNAAA